MDSDKSGNIEYTGFNSLAPIHINT